MLCALRCTDSHHVGPNYRPFAGWYRCAGAGPSMASREARSLPLLTRMVARSDALGRRRSNFSHMRRIINAAGVTNPVPPDVVYTYVNGERSLLCATPPLPCPETVCGAQGGGARVRCVVRAQARATTTWDWTPSGAHAEPGPCFSCCSSRDAGIGSAPLAVA